MKYKKIIAKGTPPYAIKYISNIESGLKALGHSESNDPDFLIVYTFESIFNPKCLKIINVSSNDWPQQIKEILK